MIMRKKAIDQLTPRLHLLPSRYGVFVGSPNNGIGPPETPGKNQFHPPSKTFTDTMMLEILGMKMQLQHVPSETSDEIIIFLPDCLNFNNPGNETQQCPVEDVTYNTAPQDLGSGFLASAEAVQGPSFPNLYSLRGTTFRNPLSWYQSIDVLRLYNAWAMVPSHGVPLMGDSNIEALRPDIEAHPTGIHPRRNRRDGRTAPVRSR